MCSIKKVLATTRLQSNRKASTRLHFPIIDERSTELGHFTPHNSEAVNWSNSDYQSYDLNYRNENAFKMYKIYMKRRLCHYNVDKTDYTHLLS